ncbi:MAG: OprO/OprP family phosphate-selective porin [Planctomycetaceae bacterium]|nr:OprO/OprP family phosphate-selective porin [Planctomycetaceae bacterium]
MPKQMNLPGAARGHDRRRMFVPARPLLTPLMLAALGVAGAARADDAQNAQELLKRIERLEASNRALASEVESMRAAEGDAWLSEERAAEIRAIVGDVLADADARTSLQSTAMTAGWDDGFFLQSPDGRFKLQVGGLIQTRYIYGYVPDGDSGVSIPNSPVSDTVENRSGFDLPATRLDFKGHVFGEEFQYRIQGEFSNQGEAILGQNPFANLGNAGGTFRTLDAYIRVQLNDEMAVRAGQFKLPFAREQLVDRENQLAVSRSVISEHLGLGRSQGVEFAWAYDDYRVMAAFSNGMTDNIYGPLKVAGTEPLSTPWDSDAAEWALTARYEWKIAGSWKQFESMTSPPGDQYGFMIGVAGHWQEGDPDLGNSSSTSPPNSVFAATADFSAMYGGATLFGSFTYVFADSGQAYVQGTGNFNPSPSFDIEDSDVWGAVLQASIYTAPKWELFVRGEVGDANIDNIGVITNPSGASALWTDSLLVLTTVGVNWYIDGEDMKWTSDVGIAWNNVDGIWFDGDNGWRASAEENQVVFRSQLQLAF